MFVSKKKLLLSVCILIVYEANALSYAAPPTKAPPDLVSVFLSSQPQSSFSVPNAAPIAKTLVGHFQEYNRQSASWSHPEGQFAAGHLSTATGAVRAKVHGPQQLIVLGDISSIEYARNTFPEEKTVSVGQCIKANNMRWTPKENILWLKQHIDKRANILRLSDDSALYRQKSNPYPETSHYTFYLLETALLQKYGYQPSSANSNLLVHPSNLPENHQTVALIDTSRLPANTMQLVEAELQTYLSPHKPKPTSILEWLRKVM